MKPYRLACECFLTFLLLSRPLLGRLLSLIQGGLECHYSAASDHVFWQPILQWDHPVGEEPCLELQPTVITLESEAMPLGANFRDRREYFLTFDGGQIVHYFERFI
ncbi:unnamed protein product [Echinostoma caproni]|uniref:Exported protein n=1 Tax=Echinostoma caproni TaxID=27848 RepID=A0A183AQG0_9TREM|nr:unnamed protein product [Echinostoma caproni]